MSSHGGGRTLTILGRIEKCNQGWQDLSSCDPHVLSMGMEQWFTASPVQWQVPMPDMTDAVGRLTFEALLNQQDIGRKQQALHECISINWGHAYKDYRKLR